MEAEKEKKCLQIQQLEDQIFNLSHELKLCQINSSNLLKSNQSLSQQLSLLRLKSSTSHLSPTKPSSFLAPPSNQRSTQQQLLKQLTTQLEIKT